MRLLPARLCGTRALALSACRLIRVTMLGAVSVLLVCLQACSSSSQPTSSSVPPPLDTRELRFVSGEGSGPAAGVAINAASNPLRQTDSTGRATFDVPLPIGAAYDAIAPGQFLTRISLVRSLTEPITLWSVAPAYPAEFFHELVFTELLPGRRLSRPAPGITYLRLSPDIGNDPDALAAQRQAAAQATAVTEGKVQFVIADTPPAGALTTFELSIDPTQSAGGLTYLGLTRGLIREGRITYRNIFAARSVPVSAHEMGHSLGLGHDYTTLPGLMGARGSDFSAAERVAVRMMFRRYPGTEWPDNDRNAQATGSDDRSTTVVIPCNPELP